MSKNKRASSLKQKKKLLALEEKKMLVSISQEFAETLAKTVMGRW